MEELRVQAALGRAETKDNLEEQRKKIAVSILQLKREFSEVYDTSKENYNDSSEKVNDKLNDFQTRFILVKKKQRNCGSKKREKFPIN